MSQKSYRLVRLLLLMFLGLWLVLIMFPFYFQIITSLKDVAEVNRIAPTFWPEVFVFQNYSAIWNEPGNFKSLIDSFIIATGNTILSLFFGTLAGYALARFPRQSGGENVAMWILSNRMFPPVAVLLPMFFLFEELFGTTDTHMALIILYLVFNMPLAVWLMMVFFRDVPRELEEAAYVDGHNPFKVFFTITLPLVGPGMIAVGHALLDLRVERVSVRQHVHRHGREDLPGHHPELHERQPDAVESGSWPLASSR